MPMFFTGDPAADWDMYCEEQEQLLERMPVCEDCEKHIADDHAYYINGVWICEHCMEAYRREVWPE